MFSKITTPEELAIYKNQLSQVLSVIDKQLTLPKDARVGIMVIGKLRRLAGFLEEEILRYEKGIAF